MTEREKINMLRRAVADLTERARTLEARPVLPYIRPETGAAPLPILPPNWTLLGQYDGQTKCSCPPGTICANVACPNRAVVTCAVSNTYGSA